MSSGPQPLDIQSLALWNPRAALAIVRGDVFEPVVYNVRAEFTATAVGSFIEASLDTPLGNVSQDTWISDALYTVETPNSDVGSLFRAQQQWFNQENPGVDVEVKVFGTQDYAITPRTTPIQNFARDFQCCWPGGWTIYYQQNVQVRFTLTRALILTTGTPAVGETPYRVVLTFRGWRLGCQDLGRQGDAAARQVLREKYNIGPGCS